MPLLDHFYPPQPDKRLLPPRYYAEAMISWGRAVEIDVATIRHQAEDSTAGVPAPFSLLDPQHERLFGNHIDAAIDAWRKVVESIIFELDAARDAHREVALHVGLRPGIEYNGAGLAT